MEREELERINKENIRRLVRDIRNHARQLEQEKKNHNCRYELNKLFEGTE